MITCQKDFTLTVNGPPPDAYWEMEEAAGTRITSIGNHANDLHNNGVATGNAAGIIGNGFHFPSGVGGIEYVTTSGLTLVYNPLTSGGLTLTFWIKFLAVSGFGYRIQPWLSAFDFSFLAKITLAAVSTTISPPVGPDVVANLPFAFALGQWFFITCQYSAATLKTSVSINAGTPTLSPTTVSLVGDNTSPAQFLLDGIGNPDECVVDEMALYLTRVLSASEITAQYNGGVGKRPAGV